MSGAQTAESTRITVTAKEITATGERRNFQKKSDAPSPADPTDPEHVADMDHHGIEPIDLVVVNLYPFSSDPSIELIDIGGPAMVRAAAKKGMKIPGQNC